MRKMNTELVFLIRDGREEHRQFRDTFKIKPPILIDEDGKVGEAYHIYQPHCRLRDSYQYYMAPAVYLIDAAGDLSCCLLYTSPSPRDGLLSRMPSSA